ncbi:MAG: hypothetical protein ABSC17_07305 [Thermacetogeniaceae bacterium]
MTGLVQVFGIQAIQFGTHESTILSDLVFSATIFPIYKTPNI